MLERSYKDHAHHGSSDLEVGVLYCGTGAVEKVNGIIKEGGLSPNSSGKPDVIRQEVFSAVGSPEKKVSIKKN